MLIVDDDAEIGALLSELLRDEAFEPIIASGLVGALETVSRTTVAVVLSDTLGADPRAQTRWERLERLRDAAAPAGVIITTAHDPAAFAQWHRRGFQGFVARPFDLDTVVAAVRGALAAKRGERAGL